MGSKQSLNRILVTLTLLAAVHLVHFASPAPSSAASVTLTWTAPGDDGETGRAAAYDLRYSGQMITADNFLQAIAATGLPDPGLPGTSQSCVLDGLEVGMTYYIAIKTVDQAGNWSAMSNVIARVPPVPPASRAPVPLAFSPPWPNPAQQQARFDCSLPEAAEVRVEVYDVAGRRVRRLAEEFRDAGPGEVAFDLRDDQGMQLAGGVYLVRARLGDAVFTRRLVIAR
jgi:hypothetical protein